MENQKTISHVLGKFSPTENQLMAQVLELVVGAVELSLKQGIEKAMSLYNSRTITENSGYKPPL